MCLILFAHRVRPDFPLVLAANRDEFFSRPTEQAHLWRDANDNPQFIAGKDLKAGGTWLGVSPDGRFSAVTNIRDPSQTDPRPRSRGELPVNFLTGPLSAAQYAESLVSGFTEYSGYNLLVGDHEDLFYINNSEQLIRKLPPGVYGLSNGLLDTPWPKVEKGKRELAALLDQEKPLTTDDLLGLMLDREPAADALLPNTGLPLELERRLSSAFIINTDRDYGTLCSSAVIFENGAGIHLSEQNYDREGNPQAAHYFRLGC